MLGPQELHSILTLSVEGPPERKTSGLRAGVKILSQQQQNIYDDDADDDYEWLLVNIWYINTYNFTIYKTSSSNAFVSLTV